MAHGGLTRLLELAWHPVAASEQLTYEDPVAVRLLGRALVLARLGDGRLAALEDRCLHRSTPLALGSVEPAGVRCAHHGWVWDPDGVCVEIPGQRSVNLPARARVAAFPICEAAGQVWVRLDDRAPWPVPLPPAPSGRNVLSRASVGGLRRVEHLLERACGAWAQGGPAKVERVERRGAELWVTIEGAPLPLGLAGAVRTDVRVALPLSILATQSDAHGRTRWLWACAVPEEASASSLVWSVGGTGVDATVRERIAAVLTEALLVESAKSPSELALDHATEVSVKADRVSVAYRSALGELGDATRRGPGPLATWLGSPRRSGAELSVVVDRQIP